MAIEKNIVIGADLSGLEAKLGELIDLLKTSQSQANKTADSVSDIADATRDIGKSAEGSEKGVKVLNKGFKGMGVAIKAAGIGLLLSAMGILKDLFDNNQKTVDLFNTSFNSLQIAFSDFSKWISANIGGVADFFKAIFEDPKQALIDFADSFVRNIQERFESYLDTLGYLASAVKKVFSGDFKGALEDVKSAGKETIDVFTGVNNSFDKGVELVTKAAKATAKYVVETVKSGAAMTEMNKQAEIAEVLMQGLIEKYDLQAEKLRQVRDDERISIDERIKANEELGKVLEEQEALMLETAQKVLNAKARQLQLDENNIEFQKEFISAQNELAGVQAQVAGFRSEQLMNEMALQREILDIERARGENEIELFEMTSEARRAAMLQERKRIQQEIMDIGTVAFLKKDALREELENTEENTDRYYEILNERKLIDQEYSNNLADLKRQEEAIERSVQDSKVQMSMDAIGALNGLVQAFAADNEEAQKKAFMVNKVAGIASAVISTAQAVAKALAETTDPTPTQSFRFGNAAIAAATGAAQVAAIARQQFNASGTVDTNIQSNTSASTSPSFNLVGSTGQNAILESLQRNPVKAYVVGSDVTSQQQLDRNRINQVSFP